MSFASTLNELRWILIGFTSWSSRLFILKIESLRGVVMFYLGHEIPWVMSKLTNQAGRKMDCDGQSLDSNIFNDGSNPFPGETSLVSLVKVSMVWIWAMFKFWIAFHSRWAVCQRRLRWTMTGFQHLQHPSKMTTHGTTRHEQKGVHGTWHTPLRFEKHFV